MAITPRDAGKLLAHGKKYTKQHISAMRKMMREGKTFAQAHSATMKMKIPHLKKKKM